MEFLDYQEDDQQQAAPTPTQPAPGGRGGGLLDTLIGLISGPNGRLLIGAAVGLVIGLIFAWVVWPVQWYDANAEHLRADLQADYVKMVAESYAMRTDMERAQARIGNLGPHAPAALAAVEAEWAVNGNDTQRLALNLIKQEYESRMGGAPPADAGQGGDAAQGDGQTGQPADGGGINTLGLLGAACFVLLLVGGAVAYYFFRNRNKTPREQTAAQKAQEITRQAQDLQTDYAAMGEEPPIAQWMTTFLMGDDLFDDSFSIDSPAGEFMGECGVGIADTVGVGEPKRVSAFEVWIFDKNDIQTVTKVLMAENLFADEAAKQRLSAKGEPVLAGLGYEVVLETATLQMVVRIVDLAYGDGAMPEKSYYERATIELAIWPKS